MEPGGTLEPEEQSATLALEPANVDFTLRLGPLRAVMGDVAGLLGDTLLNLLGMFYPPTIGKKANVVVTELVTNVFENISFGESSFELRLVVNPETLKITVSNQVTDEQFERVSARIALLQHTADAKKLLTQTIRERRPQRLKGGLGMIRLVAENRFALTVARNDGTMTVCAEYSLKGNA